MHRQNYTEKGDNISMDYNKLPKAADDRTAWDALFDLERRIRRAEAYNACRDTMSEYTWVHSASDQPGTVALYTMEDPEARCDFVAGSFGYGPNGVKEHFDRFMVDLEGERDGDEIQDMMTGRLYSHDVTSMAIEVAWDAETAVTKLDTWGLETGWSERNAPDSAWALTGYWIDFKPEGGRWKFWHFRMIASSLTRFQMGNGWLDDPRYDFYPNLAKYKGVVPQPTRLEYYKIYHGYNNTGKPFFVGECYPPNPTPYRHFKDEWRKVEGVICRLEFDGTGNRPIDMEIDPNYPEYADLIIPASQSECEFFADMNPEWRAIMDARKRRAQNV